MRQGGREVGEKRGRNTSSSVAPVMLRIGKEGDGSQSCLDEGWFIGQSSERLLEGTPRFGHCHIWLPKQPS